MQRIYIETSVISLITARPSRDLLTTSNQQRTVEWWSRQRQRFETFVSEVVIEEAGRGDPVAAQRRLALIEGIPSLALTEPARSFAKRLLRATAIPEEAEVDALHVAIATINGMDYLLSWNLRHIAGAEIRPRIEAVCLSAGYRPPSLCTPADFVEES